MKTRRIEQTCWFSDEPCPRCGKRTITNGRERWCSTGGCGFFESQAKRAAQEKKKS